MLRKTSKDLEVMMRIRQEVVPVVLEADKRGEVDLDLVNYECGTPSCFVGHLIYISRKNGWKGDAKNWRFNLLVNDMDGHDLLFGPADCGPLPGRIAYLDELIKREMEGYAI
jgi:hypothetical protein